MNVQQQVAQFHDTFACPNLVGSTPSVVQERKNLRWNLIEEEVEELRDALHADDIVETADALADIVYVCYGAALEFGIDLDRVLAEVHSSNMSKVWPDGTVHYRQDGKVEKPHGSWRAPNIARVLNATV